MCRSSTMGRTDCSGSSGAAGRRGRGMTRWWWRSVSGGDIGSTRRRGGRGGNAEKTLMSYESVVLVESSVRAGVCFRVARMSFGRRVELMRKVRELSRRVEFLEAGEDPGEWMDAGLLKAEIDRMFLLWGLIGVSGLVLDGAEATPETLVERGPE